MHCQLAIQPILNIPSPRDWGGLLPDYILANNFSSNSDFDINNIIILLLLAKSPPPQPSHTKPQWNKACMLHIYIHIHNYASSVLAEAYFFF